MDFKGSVGYLIHDLAQAITAEADIVLRRNFHIGFSQYKVLLVLDGREGVQQKEIARSLSQSEASISRQIGLLIDKDLVEIGFASDNRQHPIYLTPKGHQLARRASAVLNAGIGRRFDGLSEQQLLHLQLMLSKLRAGF